MLVFCEVVFCTQILIEKRVYVIYSAKSSQAKPLVFMSLYQRYVD